MDREPKILEAEAYSFLYQEKFDEAFGLFRKAGDIYKTKGNHKQAAICLAAAGSSWSIKCGEKTFYNSAMCYEEASKEAERAGDYEYASLLYKYAAANYERDMEFLQFADCFYNSKECRRKFLNYLLLNRKKLHPIAKSEEERGVMPFARRVCSWLALTFSYIIWGHGERPSRTVLSGLAIIFASALLYTLGYLARDGVTFKPDFFEALYFSVVTFSTVGYGDIIAVGATKAVVMFEAMCGMFVMSIFIVGLSRKYLRI
ncbi:MAG: potassium channel family protein [Candidatus Omnitrophica bacterium]|jgi:tetratricopeptide (TPR) repeat protein|nr:potassium channel family protein [Candidatus Omnitrophota bacterium]